jgi:methanethiol oxidase
VPRPVKRSRKHPRKPRRPAAKANSAGHAAHPAKPGMPLNGGPQMVEISRDRRRIYSTNSLHTSWDDQFYPEGMRSWMVKLDAKPEGGMEFDPKFFLEFDGLRSHQVHLEGGDASSDSYCYS